MSLHISTLPRITHIVLRLPWLFSGCVINYVVTYFNSPKASTEGSDLMGPDLAKEFS
jgi:hypothetical protein